MSFLLQVVLLLICLSAYSVQCLFIVATGKVLRMLAAVAEQGVGVLGNGVPSLCGVRCMAMTGSVFKQCIAVDSKLVVVWFGFES